MRSGGLLLRVPAALRPAFGRALVAGLVVALLAPATAAGAGTPVRAPRMQEPVAAPLPPPPGTTTLVSKNRKDGFPNGPSTEPSMSTNGRWIAFTSVASDLVAGDGNGASEVFLRDLKTQKTIRVPLDSGFVPDGGRAGQPAISGDGTVVAFTYRPPSKVAALAAVGTEVLAYDRTTGRAEVVSRTPDGVIAYGASQPSVSRDGRYVAYTSTNDWSREDENTPDVFRYDRKTGRTIRLSVGPTGGRTPGTSENPSISGDGNLVAFTSDDILIRASTGKIPQVYVRDISAQQTSLVSSAATGRAPNGAASEVAISGNGRFVAYASSATNLLREGSPGAGSPGVFRADLRTGDTILISITPSGAAASGDSREPSITPDGRMVAFTSTAPDLLGLGPEDGRLAVFVTREPTSVFLRDVDGGETIEISVPTPATDLSDAGSQSSLPSVAGGGRLVAFASDSPALVAGDSRATDDVFLRDLPPVPVVNPPVLDLGAGAVGTQSAPGAATLANTGWSPLAVTGASVTGSNKGDFKIVADGCQGRQLERNDACSVSVVFAPTAKGTRTATLAIKDAYTGSPRTVRLRGSASQAKITLDPELGPPGIVTIATGSGFPPGAVVHLHWSAGITANMADVTADATGAFEVPMLVFHKDVTGKRNLVAESATGTGFPPAKAEMLVVKPSSIPPTFARLRIIDLPIFLVLRG